PVTPLNARTTNGAAQPRVTRISGTPSPVTSPTATSTPPVNDGANAKKPACGAPVAPSKTRTCGPPPGPAPVTMSGTPSPLTSPCATDTPPWNALAYASNSDVTAPFSASARTAGGPPAALTTKRRSGETGIVTVAVT